MSALVEGQHETAVPPAVLEPQSAALRKMSDDLKVSEQDTHEAAEGSTRESSKARGSVSSIELEPKMNATLERPSGRAFEQEEDDVEDSEEEEDDVSPTYRHGEYEFE